MSNDKIMFKTAAEGWFKNIKNNSKHSTYIKYCMIYHKYLEECFADKSIEELSELYLADKIFELSDELSLSNSIYKSINCVLNQILCYAGHYYRTHYVKISLKKTYNHIKPICILNKSEQIRLLKILYDDIDKDKLGIIICLATGLRLGEICALKWSDIDLNEKLLHVNRTVQRIRIEDGASKTALIEDDPKSIYSKREIPLSDSIIPLLSKFYIKNAYILKNDKPMEPRTYQNHFQKYLNAADIERKNFHILRHTFATNCIDNGTDIKSLSEILGHSNVNITLNRYVHPTLETKRQHMNSLFSIYTGYINKTP